MKKLNTYLQEANLKLKGRALQDHQTFQFDTKGCNKGLRLMLEGIQEYCNGASSEGCPVGEDFYTGEEVEGILRSLRKLLSSHGTFDGATLDSFIQGLADEHKLDID